MNKKEYVAIMSIIVIMILALSIYFISQNPTIQKEEILPLIENEKDETLLDSDIESEKNKVIEYETPPILPPIPADISRDSISNTEKEIITLIDDLVGADWQKKEEAKNRLVSLGSLAVPLLLYKLEEASLDLKGEIIFLLGRIGDKEATPTLLKMTDDENSYIRRNAIESLGKIKDESAFDELTYTLFDEDCGVRERSAWALGELNDRAAVEYLIDKLNDEAEDRVKLTIINALGKLKDGTATPSLLTELKAENDQVYKNEVVTALGEIGDSKALPELIQYYNTLTQYEPEEPMFVFQWELNVKTAKEAIRKIKQNNKGI